MSTPTVSRGSALRGALGAIPSSGDPQVPSAAIGSNLRSHTTADSRPMLHAEATQQSGTGSHTFNEAVEFKVFVRGMIRLIGIRIRNDERRNAEDFRENVVRQTATQRRIKKGLDAMSCHD